MYKKQYYSSLLSKLKECIILALHIPKRSTQCILPLENCVPVKKLVLREWLKCFSLITTTILSMEKTDTLITNFV
jgi:hypothetical protein